MDLESVKYRFIFSVILNGTRSAISFLSGLLIARGLNPSGYGDFAFLIGSFTAIRVILDMGSSTAFYTFIAQNRRSRKFFSLYFGWLLLQFAVTVIIIAFLMPQEMLARIWVNHDREIVLLAFAASFMQQQVWQTVIQIFESIRKTVVIQFGGVLVSIAHLAIIAFLLLEGIISVKILFYVLIAEYVVAVVVAGLFMRRDARNTPKAVDMSSARDIIVEFWNYCKPLLLLSLVTFITEFADRWMLQYFGGSAQQGFYQIALQFSTISLLVTKSILNPFWKEIAEAHHLGISERVESLYYSVSRGLLMLGAVLSGFMIPWTKEIIEVFLGQAYISAAPVLMVMFLFPIHQSMGQVCSTMLLASGNTRIYMIISVAVMVVSIPSSYFVLAPANFKPLEGFGLGAMGMGFKMLIINVVAVNIQAFMLSRIFNWKFSWLYQVIGISAVIVAGYIAKSASYFIMPDSASLSISRLIMPMLISGVLYTVIIGALLWMMPWLGGLQYIKSVIIKRIAAFR